MDERCKVCYRQVQTIQTEKDCPDYGKSKAEQCWYHKQILSKQPSSPLVPDSPLETVPDLDKEPVKLRSTKAPANIPLQKPFIDDPLPLPETPRPAKHRVRNVLLFSVIVLLLVGSGGLAYYTILLRSQLQTQTSDIASQASAIQARNTVIQNGYVIQTALSRQQKNLQVTLTAEAQSTAQALTQGTPDAKLIAQSSQLTVHVGDSFAAFFELENTGTSIWSNEDGYTLACVSNTFGITPQGYISSCIGRDQNPVQLNNDRVAPGEDYIFYIQFTASSLSVGHHYNTYWQLNHKGTFFGIRIYVTINVVA